MLRRITYSLWLALAVALVGAALGAPAAQANPARADLGGGSGLIVGGDFLCTLTTIGHDAAGRLVGLTAAHCGGPGSAVVPEQNQGVGPVGTVARVNGALDYAVIVFDPAKVTPRPTVGPVTITGTGPAPTFPNLACKLGRTTGYTCGLVVFTDYPMAEAWSLLCVDEGDSGAPVVVGTTLVGMVNAFLSVPCLGPHISKNTDAVFGDINRVGGPGAGFTPIR